MYMYMYMFYTWSIIAFDLWDLERKWVVTNHFGSHLSLLDVDDPYMYKGYDIFTSISISDSPVQNALPTKNWKQVNEFLPR